MEVGVRVFAENRSLPSRRQTTRAYLTFVAVDERGPPADGAAAALETARRSPPVRGRAPRRAVRLRELRAMKSSK